MTTPSIPTPKPLVVIKTKNGSKVLELPDVPEHHHFGPCSCQLAVAYVRVSDVGDREKLASPDIQMDSIVEMAKRKGLRIVDVVFDIDETGTSFENRSVSLVLDCIRAGLYRKIALWKWSRWGRELEQSLYWTRMAKLAGGEVLSATEEFDETPAGLLARNMTLAVADHQSKVIGETWKSVHKARRKRGLPTSGHQRFGYTKLEDEKDIRITDEGLAIIYVPKPGEKEILADAYDRFVSGTTMGELTRDFNAAGHKTTMGNQWTPQALKAMLDTGFAAGYIRERSQPNGKTVNTIAGYDVWWRGSHEPLISEDLWQSYLAKRKANAELPPRSRKAAHALSSLLFCGVCGYRLVTRYCGRGTTHQWVCQRREPNHPKVNVSLSDSRATARVLEWIDEMVDGGGSVAEDAQRLQERTRAVETGDQTRVELTKAERKLKRLLDLYIDEVIDREGYLSRKAQLEAEVGKLRGVLAESENRVRTLGGDLNFAFTNLREHWETFTSHERREMLKLVIAGIVVSPGRGDAQKRMTLWSAWGSEDFSAWRAALLTTAA